MDEEREGGGGSLTLTYEKMGNRWISDSDVLVFFNTLVHYGARGFWPPFGRLGSVTGPGVQADCHGRSSQLGSVTA
jgi:hypothetical protein